jgi:hypothetical protein
MAIEQYGESILAGVRSRQEQDRKRREKEQLQAALTGLGVTIGYKVGNQVLANSMNNFLNNEEVFAAKAQYKSALNNQASLLGLQKQIDSSGMSATDFFANSMRPQFEARAKEIVPFDRVGPAGAYDEMVTAEVRKMAEQQAEAYSKALEAANNLGSEEDFANMVALNAKEAKATNILDAATRTVGRFFTGRSAQDVEEDALNAITNGRMSNNAEKLNIFMEEYNRTKDLQGSYDFANLVVPEPTEEERFLESRKIEYVELGDNIYKRETIERKDRNTGEIKIEQKKPKLADEFQDEEETETAAVKGLMSTFNYGTNARDELTTPAYAEFVRKARDREVNGEKKPINPEQPRTIAEYRALAEIYNGLTTEKNNLRDAFRQEQVINFQELLLNDAVDIQAFLAIMKTGTKEEKDEAIRGVAALINSLMQRSEEAVTGTTSFPQI